MSPRSLVVHLSAKFMLPLSDELNTKRESNSAIPSLKLIIRDKGVSDFDHCIAALDIIREDCNTQSVRSCLLRLPGL